LRYNTPETEKGRADVDCDEAVTRGGDGGGEEESGGVELAF
jgi:hypothetical protein